MRPPGREDRLLPGGVGTRVSAELCEKAIREGGGNFASEAAVAAGLKWLALHQCDDGHWSLDKFPTCGSGKTERSEEIHLLLRPERGQWPTTPRARRSACFPFLGIGITHKSDAEWKGGLLKNS